MEEFFHISHSLMDTDCDGHVILCYELMIEVEHCFRIKRGGGAGHHHPLSLAGNTSPCPWDKLEDVAWNKPDSKTLEHLVWSVYNPIIKLPGASPIKSSGSCKCAVRRRHRPNLMSHPWSECTQLSLLHPQVGCQKGQRPLRPWTWLPIKSTLQRRELWEEK